ncbi:MAG: hypothetical protein ABL856_02955 [Gallionella sp.]
MKWLKSKSPSKLATLMVSAAVLGLASQSAAALTASGTAINNTASLTYSVGGSTQTPIASAPGGNSIAGTAGAPTSFLVDKKVDFTVTGGAIVNVQPNQAGVVGTTPIAANSNTVLTYTISNIGNDPQGFILTAGNASPVVPTDVFDPTLFQTFVDTNNNGVYDAADTGTSIATLAPGASVLVFVISTIPANSIVPAPLVNGNQALVTLTAQAADTTGTLVGGSTVAGSTNGVALAATAAAAGSNATGGANVSTVDIVFAEVANAGLGLANPANNGIAAANDTYNIQTAMLTVTKLSSVVCDPVTGNVAPNNIPGAAIQWAITISNAAGAGAPANLALPTAISDILDVNTTFDPNKVTGAAVAPFCLGTTAFNAINGLGFTLGTAAPAAGAAPATVAPAGALLLNGAAVTAAPAAGGTVTVDFATLLPAGGARVTAGDLNPGEFITVYFNVFVN